MIDIEPLRERLTPSRSRKRDGEEVGRAVRVMSMSAIASVVETMVEAIFVVLGYEIWA